MPYVDKSGRTCGFLNIEEIENSGSFIRRYFLLDQNNERLLYYMDNPNNLPATWRNTVGEIFLQYVSKVSDGKKLRPKVSNCFVINVAGRRYFMEAEDEDDKTEWIEALNNASKITVPQDDAVKNLRTTEWQARDLSQKSYVTEIAGGVVCKMPVQTGEDVSGESSSEDEESTSRSSSSGRVSPSNSLCRTLGEAPRTTSSRGSTSLKAGYGVKQGAVRKSWKRRFFLLHENGFSYYRNEQDKSPIRTVPVSEILEARQSSGAHVNRDNLFELITSKRIFYIQCDTPDEMLSWIDAIRSLLRSRKMEERKSMQDTETHQTLEDDICGKTYPKEVWLRDRLGGEVGGRGKLRKKNWMFW
ncbi:pleckstrin homology domain-containing family A member 1-like [Haliotis cracherodii]|uniref:pleckstrin homology domain-containing family A member 1-like n=1 Tax=Haliotis cracherodii TaxID=6455 RepID=UPI0039E9035B